MAIPLPTTALRLLSPCTRQRVFFTLPAGLAGHAALTFDDGPHPEVTPRVLDALAAAKVHASFFCQGSAARAHPELVRRARREGHQVAAHGMTHESARRQTAGEALQNAADCNALLADILGEAVPKLYRPPYGELTLGAFLALLQHGFQLAFWDYDSNDSFVTQAGDIVLRLQQRRRLDRSVLLFHDDYAITAEAIPAIAAVLRDRGLTPTKIGDFPQ